MKLTISILAGGHSTRFWPLEEKNLFEFYGTPLIIYQIKRYAFFFKKKLIKPNFIVVTNEFNHKVISEHLKQYKIKNYKVIVQKLPNQSGAVMATLNQCELNNPLLIINSNDIFSERLINDLIKQIRSEEVLLSATEVNQYFPGGYLEIDKKKNKVISIKEKPDPKLVPVKLKLFRFVMDLFPNPKELKAIFTGIEEDIDYEQAINALIKNKPCHYLIGEEPFSSLKYPWHILSAMKIFLSNLKDNTVKADSIDSTASIIGKVFIDDGVVIGSYAKIVGPCYIGKNTVIGDYALVRDSHIGKDCIIGAHSEVARSYLGNRVMLHRNYVGDSILSDKSSLGANAITANWRFDKQIIKSSINGEKIDTLMNKLGLITGKGVQIGVGTCLMPGVKINKNSVLKPNTTVFADVK